MTWTKVKQCMGEKYLLDIFGKGVLMEQMWEEGKKGGRERGKKEKERKKGGRQDKMESQVFGLNN